MNNWFAAAAAGLLAVLGFGGDRMNTTTPHFNNGSTTHKEEGMNGDFGRKMASSTKTVDFTCVGAAVATREASLQSAVSTYSAGASSAYSARATSLASAYTLTDKSAVRKGVQSAWQTFTTSMQGVKRAWQKSKESAWQTYRTTLKSCGSGASEVSDSGNAWSEMSGQ